MKNNKQIIIVVLLLVVILGVWGVHHHLHRVSTSDNPIRIEDVPNNSTNDSTMPGLLLSKEEAMQLASEQIDLNAYNLSFAELKKIGSENYYLFDVVNKSGPSFGTQLAIHERTGEVLAYDPGNQELMSMTKFPIATPIAEQQDWNGIFVPVENSTASKGFTIELFQSDQNRFEFKVTYAEDETIELYQVAEIDGSKANYQNEDGYAIAFVKNGKSLAIKETGNSPWAEKELVLQGEYEQKVEENK